MKLFTKLVVVWCFIALSASAMAQKKDSTYVGSANGIVRDSVYNYVLQSATIAVYKIRDSSLVSYQLSNNFGEFSFRELPVGIRLKIIVSYIGYKSVSRGFTVPTKSKQIDFKNLNLDRNENELKEVVVRATPPPVSMNGDTLEFNADAFTLDKNAVAEDLLRKLPGITVWGDGTITFNGKQIRQVLVEGKPFFGGDSRIATQNIAKDAIDKIQVYQQPKDPNDRLDSLTDINVKLKKNKKFGHFGKIAAGYGTDNHYEADANINYFNSKTQIGLVGASNNINKTAKDVSTLMRNSTFKGTGANVEYQPDFNTQGVNRSNSGGFILQHDFIPNPDFYNNNRLTANYFINNSINTINQNSKTITRLGGDSTQILQSNSNNKSNNTSQSFDARYDKQKRDYNFYVFTAASTNSGHSQNGNQSSSSSSQGLQSNNDESTTRDNNSKNISFETGFTSQQPMLGGDHPFNKFNINYSINAGSNNDNRITTTRFVSFTDPTQNKYFDRRYANKNDDTKQHLYMNLGDLAEGFFAHKGVMNRVNIEVKNNLDVNLHHEDNNVQDKDTLSGNYLINPYLTNSMKTTVVDERPALVLGKTFDKYLANRYIRSLNINFNAEAQFFHQNNSSDHSFQNFNSDYRRFIPSAGISYHNNQFGDFEDTYSLNFASSVKYPSVQQLYPLVDSANQYNIQQGNPNLMPAANKTIGFTFKHINRQTKNTFNYDLSISAGITNNSFADSSITDNTGRYTHYTVNAGESKNLDISGNLNKAFKFTNHQLQISFNTSFNLSRNPGYINTELILSNNFSNSNLLNLYYTYGDKLAIDLKQGYSHYYSKQNGSSNNEFNNSIIPTAFSASVNCTKRLTINSNITYNHTTSTGTDATNFTIWNASATYRFMQGNNLELKIAVLDLLHQNTGIINYANNNFITHGTINVLQQYGMITLSYFPRKFGKAKKKE